MDAGAKRTHQAHTRIYIQRGIFILSTLFTYRPSSCDQVRLTILHVYLNIQWNRSAQHTPITNINTCTISFTVGYLLEQCRDFSVCRQLPVPLLNHVLLNDQSGK